MEHNIKISDTILTVSLPTERLCKLFDFTLSKNISWLPDVMTFYVSCSCDFSYEWRIRRGIDYNEYHALRCALIDVFQYYFNLKIF